MTTNFLKNSWSFYICKDVLFEWITTRRIGSVKHRCEEE